MLNNFLVKEKHNHIAAVKSGEDKIEALEAELEYLRVQVRIGGSTVYMGDNSFTDEHSGQNN